MAGQGALRFSSLVNVALYFKRRFFVEEPALALAANQKKRV